jgi:hypothetical protein
MTWIAVFIAALFYAIHHCSLIDSDPRNVDVIQKAGNCFAVFTGIGEVVLIPCPVERNP